MIIETRYNIGDTVYLFSSGAIISGIIVSINVSMYDIDGFLRICYDVKYHDICNAITKPQGSLFISREELIKSL